MENILIGFAFIIGIIIITSIINEKKLHMPHEIALIIVSFIISVIIILLQRYGIIGSKIAAIESLKNFDFNNFLLECTLGFILFASASKMQINKFMKNIIPIGYLATMTTVITSFLYGSLFCIISSWFNLNIDFWVCVILGAAIAFTDSITASGILKKLGISKGMSSVIEGETLFNDGVGIAIFIFASAFIKNIATENLMILFIKEIFGAVVVGLIVSYISFKLLKMSNNPVVHILISLFVVSASYSICEYFSFSGVIACAIAGMYFAYNRKKNERWIEVVDSKEMYDDFWNIIENLLNSMLYVLVGLMVISLNVNKQLLIIIPTAIILNFVTRFIGVSVSTILIGKKNIPSKYNFKEFVMLLTWTGLKGGVSLALIMSAKNLVPQEVYEILLSATMITILFTTIVQGLLTPTVYKKIEKIREKRIEENI